jgi:hypothetical protein
MMAQIRRTVQARSARPPRVFRTDRALKFAACPRFWVAAAQELELARLLLLLLLVRLGRAAGIHWSLSGQVLAGAKEEWPQQRCIKLAQRLEQGAPLAFQPLVESLLLVLPRQERQAMPGSTQASQQVKLALAEVMKAGHLVPQASELVWVQLRPVWSQA